MTRPNSWQDFADQMVARTSEEGPYEINFHVDDKEAMIRRLAEDFSDGEIDYVDGVTVQFDDFDPEARGLAVGDAELGAALAAVPDEQLDALRLAAARIADYHERQRPEDLWYRDEHGNGLGYGKRCPHTGNA